MISCIVAFVGGVLDGALTVFGMYVSGTLDDLVESLAWRRMDEHTSEVGPRRETTEASGQNEGDDASSSSGTGSFRPEAAGAQQSATEWSSERSAVDRADRPSGSADGSTRDSSRSSSGDRAARPSGRQDTEHWLEGINGSVEGKTYRLGSEPLMVGRHPECDIQAQRGEVSRRHCRLRQLRPAGEGKPVVEPLGSDREVRVNGERIDRNTSLEEDDLVEVGPILLAYRKNPLFETDHSQETNAAGIAAEAQTAHVELESWQTRIEFALRKHDGDVRKAADEHDMDDQKLRKLVAKFDFGPS
ncbi:MAG: FHA domain-containing protein [Bradymonadaceae bacterium]